MSFVAHLVDLDDPDPTVVEVYTGENYASARAYAQNKGLDVGSHSAADGSLAPTRPVPSDILDAILKEHVPEHAQSSAVAALKAHLRG